MSHFFVILCIKIQCFGGFDFGCETVSYALGSKKLILYKLGRLHQKYFIG